MASINIYGHGFQTRGDGGEIESTLILSGEEYSEIKNIAAEHGKDIDELVLDDLPRDIIDRMEEKLEDDWSFVDGESYNTMVNGFSISE